MQPASNDMLAVRQLNSLGVLTGLVKGIMNPGGTSSPVASSPAIATPSSSSSSSSEYNDCYEAIQQIEQVLNTSERYMGNSTNIGYVEAVLAVVSDSLGDDCNTGNVMPKDRSEKVTSPEEATSGCSDCKRRLYVIINGLQNILGKIQADDDSIGSPAGSMSSSLISISTLMMMPLSTTVTMA